LLYVAGLVIGNNFRLPERPLGASKYRLEAYTTLLRVDDLRHSIEQRIKSILPASAYPIDDATL
jgi:hypothetical protein